MSAVAGKFSVEQYEAINPTASVKHAGKKLTYAVPNRTTLWRVETLFTKEPSTIAWLSGFAADSVFLDVGANVGMYSVFAAIVPGARVFAFEPESQNYALLCKNIVQNLLSERVVAFSAALSDEEKFGKIHLSNFAVGGSCHSFGEAVDFNLQKKAFEFTQGCYSTTIDKLVQTGVMPVPANIKIDVDGFEHKVVAGARETLTDRTVRSLLIEINPKLAEHQWIITHLQSLGFSYDQGQVDKAARADGSFKGIGEYVFRR
jgi:FkbM family methyltransferase